MAVVVSVILALVVVVTTVLVAAGRWGDVPAWPADRRAADLPPDRPVTSADLMALRLPQAMRGYRMADVDDVLDRLAAELDDRDRRLSALQAALSAQPDPTQHSP